MAYQAEMWGPLGKDSQHCRGGARDGCCPWGHATSQRHLGLSGVLLCHERPQPHLQKETGPKRSGRSWLDCAGCSLYWHVLLWGCRAWSGDGLEPGPSVSSRCRRTCSAGREMVREGPLPAVEGSASCVPWASHLGTMGYLPSLRCVNYAHSPSWPLMQVRMMTMEALCHSSQGWLEFEGGR